MTLAQNILDKLKDHLALPWPENVSGQERVLMVVYPPSEERRIRRDPVGTGSALLKKVFGAL